MHVGNGVGYFVMRKPGYIVQLVAHSMGFLGSLPPLFAFRYSF